MTTPDIEVISAVLKQTAEKWLDSARDVSGDVKPGIMATGLTVTGHLLKRFPLEPADVATDSQIKGAGGPAVKRILAEFGEHRPFLREGGRTSRENRTRGLQLAADYSEAAEGIGIEKLAPEERTAVVDFVRSWFVEVIRDEYFSRQRISADIFPTDPVGVAVGALIEAANDRGGNIGGAVAQHLVGAKLSLRFPEELIGNDSYTTADIQTSRQGDFTVGDTAFHVTMRPTPHLMENRCKENLRHSYRPVVLVPGRFVATAVGLVELASLKGKVNVLGIEDFVGLNVEEMAVFRADLIRSGLRNLLERYNERVSASEVDPSLLIDIPANL